MLFKHGCENKRVGDEGNGMEWEGNGMGELVLEVKMEVCAMRQVGHSVSCSVV